MAKLIRRADQPGQSPPHEEAPHPDLAHMSVEERERHIAQARESHPVSLYPAMKPRLDYVLNGKAPSEKAKPEVPKKGPDVQSLNE